MIRRYSLLFLVMVAVACFSAIATAAQGGTRTCKPARFTKLQDALSHKRLSEAEIIKVVKDCGVDFRLDSVSEKELVNAGATPAILTAIQDSYPQEPGITPGPVAGGMISRDRIVSMPEPIYPPAARAVHAGGVVIVQVTVGPDGSVQSASAVSGHPLLRQAALDSVRKARFKPVLLSGKGRSYSGTVQVTFTP